MESRLEMKMIVTNDRILAKLYSIYGSRALSMELLRSHGYIEESPCTQSRSEYSGREGFLFIQYVYSPVKGTKTFQVFHHKDYDKT
ncbi:MAG: hypothetical protein WC699_02475 [Bacteroidales bacterium]